MILFAVIDIIGSLPIIISLREKAGHIQSEMASVIAAVLMILFLFLGERILSLIGINVNEFARNHTFQRRRGHEPKISFSFSLSIPFTSRSRKLNNTTFIACRVRYSEYYSCCTCQYSVYLYCIKNFREASKNYW